MCWCVFRDDEPRALSGVLTFDPRSKAWDSENVAYDIVTADARAPEIARHIASVQGDADAKCLKRSLPPQH